MDTKLNVLESNFEEIGIIELEKNEAMEIEGGGHLAQVNGEFIWVED